MLCPSEVGYWLAVQLHKMEFGFSLAANMQAGQIRLNKHALSEFLADMVQCRHGCSIAT